MSAEPEKKTVAYSSKVSFDNYVTHLHDNPPLPSRLDKGVMGHLNYGTQQALVAAFKFFNLVNKDNVPTPRLEKLVAATGEDRKALLLQMLKEGYPFLFDGSVDLSRVSPHEFEEKFKRDTGVSGSTADKAISFFLGMAAEAGVQLSPHLTKRRPSSPSAASKRPRARREKRDKGNTPPPPPPDEPPVVTGDFKTQLLAKFPKFDPSWDDGLKKQWFAGFSDLMKTTGMKEDK